MNLIARIKCALGKHQWRYYHRRIRVRWDPDTVVINASRCVCVHCRKRETVMDGLHIEHIEAARRLLEKQMTVGEAWKQPSLYVPPEGVSNESGAPEMVETDPVC